MAEILQIIKKEINMSRRITLKKPKWTCKMKQVKPEIYNGRLRIVARTNLAYAKAAPE